jgi:hypothetical protein
MLGDGDGPMMTDLMTAATPCDAAQTAGLERTRFFARQLITPDDLTQDQIYFREKHKRHNRMLHGWGVVCGACVRRGSGTCEVIVEPGYVLGPYGDEIVIDRDVRIDICKQGVSERNGCCGEELDPWCGDVRNDCPAGTLYLAVRYSECQARPVRGSGGGCGCGCDESGCEYSRIRDSFAIKLLRELPKSYTTPMKQPPMTALVPCRDRTARACPPCPTDPWVILADITVGRDCRVRNVDCFPHRRYVVSFANYFFTCPPAAGAATGVLAGVGNTVSANFDLARTMSRLSGSTDLVDLRAAMTNTAPRATVALSRADGSPVTVPAFFEVVPGETLDDLLNREGDREFFDPATDTTTTLRDLYAGSGVARTTRLTGTASALAPLEGRTLRAGAASGTAPGTASGATDAGPTTAPSGARTGSGATRAPRELATLLDPSAVDRLEREHGGDVARAAELPATAIAGIAPDSTLARNIGEMTIGDVAALSRDEFIARAAKGGTARQGKQLEKQAAKVWDAARKMGELGGRGGERDDS